MPDSQDSQSQISKELDRTASVFGTEGELLQQTVHFPAPQICNLHL